MKCTGLAAVMLASITISSVGTLQLHAANYEVTKSVFHYNPIDKGDADDFYADVYFSRSYFEHPSTQYDSHLATASLAMAMSTITGVGPFDDAWYLNQSHNIQSFFTNLGFNNVETNDDYKATMTFDTIGLCAAKKEFGDYTVIGIVPRSGGYHREWANNMHLGDGSKSDYMHEGWYNAANKLISFVQGYVSEKGVTGKVKLWMSGFSRGGATANIAAALLDNKLDKGEKVFGNSVNISREDIYAYTFEAPQGANVNVQTIKKPKDSLYSNIWNIVNPLDIVPKVAMKEYGFTRFGTDKYVTNKFYDPNGYEANRRTYNAFFSIFNQNPAVPNIADDFRMMGLSINVIGMIVDAIFSSDSSAALYDDTKSNYDANIAGAILLEELTGNLGSRSDYVRKIQTPLESVMLLFMYENAQIDSPMKSLFRAMVSSAFDSALGNGKSAKSKMQGEWGKDFGEEAYNLLDVLIDPLASTYWERPNELLSIAIYIDAIFQNHNPEAVLAHVAGQDSYYVDAYNQGKSSSDKIQVVPLIDNADYGRMKFFGYNDIGLRLDSKKGTRVINIEGFTLGKSVIHDCQPGYAGGYYSYITEEKMELFMPANRKYNISMKSYSKKPYHRCEYWAYYEYISLDNSGRTRVEKDHKKEKAWFNSDRHKRDVTIRL